MTRSACEFIKANLPLAAVPFVPEISLHKAAPDSGLGRLAERDERFGSPYWAHYWGGGLVLARHILDNPDRVAGKRVLDLGTGSGLVAIAAARAGASEVVAADIDPYAIAATTVNAEANGVKVAAWLADPTSAGPSAAWDMVTVGDLFYERETAARVIGFLRRCSARGSEILVGDPWRADLPHDQLEPIETYRVREMTGAAISTGKPSTVFNLRR